MITTSVPGREQHARRGRHYVLLSHPSEARWRHGPRWEIPTGGRKGDLEERTRAYLDGLAAYRVWLHRELAADPAFLDELRGLRLACTCAPAPAVRCPTDILLEQLAATA